MTDQSPTQVRVMTFLLLLVITTERVWGRLLSPDIWAEDGQVFLAQALSGGLASLRIPMAGSYFTLERLMMLSAVHLVPLEWLPAAVTGACVVVFAAIMSRIVSPAYEWLIPSQASRVALGCMFCLLPGLTEMIGNLCNLNWILFCWLAFVGLKDPSLPVTRAEIGLSLFVTLSIGTTVLLVPLFAWRLAVALRQKQDRRKWTLDAIQLSVLLVFGVGLLAFVPRLQGSPIPSVLSVTRMWYDHTSRLAALTPWLGDRLTALLADSFATSAYRAGKVAFLFFLVWWSWSRRHDSRAQAVMVVFLGISLWTVLASLARPYALQELQRANSAWFYYGRYSFPMSFAGLILWMTALGPWVFVRGTRRGIAVAFVALNLTLPLHRFAIGPYGEERRWLATVAALESSIKTGCPRSVNIRQYPDRRNFTYVSPHPADTCAQ